MKFVTYEHDGVVSAGVVVGPEDLLRVYPFPPETTVLSLVQSGLSAALTATTGILSDTGIVGLPIRQVRLLPPLQAPTVRDFVAFEEHVEGVARSIDESTEVVAEWYQAPTFYFTNPHSLVGPHDDVAGPAGTTMLDFELELAAVIGTDGRNLDPATAADHIFGYTVMNDFSARDLQRREMKVNLGPAKGKDFATVIGPWLVTADEFTDRLDDDGFLDLEMTVSVNGVEVGHDLSSNMSWPFADLVAYASRDSWVKAGDLLGSGTCGNGGCLAELWGRSGQLTPPPLQPGDVVSMSIDGIGTISNRILPSPVPVPIRPARARARRRHREMVER